MITVSDHRERNPTDHIYSVHASSKPPHAFRREDGEKERKKEEKGEHTGTYSYGIAWSNDI